MNVVHLHEQVMNGVHVALPVIFSAAEYYAGEVQLLVPLLTSFQVFPHATNLGLTVDIMCA